MAFSYSGNPADNVVDAVRFAVGDTNPAEPLLQDGEITYLAVQANGDTNLAAISACEAIIALVSRRCDETVGSVSVSWSQRRAGYEELLANLRRRLILNGGISVYAGGLEWLQKIQTRCNPNLVAPSFTRDLMQRPDDPYSFDRGYGGNLVGPVGTGTNRT